LSNFHIRPVDSDDKDWIGGLITERWGAEFIVAHGEVYHCQNLPGFIAVQKEERVGLVTYTIVGDSCEIVSLDSLRPCIGIGTGLLEAVKAAALESQCKRLWLVTTNDNLNALRLYQKRGFVLVTIHRNSLQATRKLKPVPLVGHEGIPIRDEIELEMILGDVT